MKQRNFVDRRKRKKSIASINSYIVESANYLGLEILLKVLDSGPRFVLEMFIWCVGMKLLRFYWKNIQYIHLISSSINSRPLGIMHRHIRIISWREIIYSFSPYTWSNANSAHTSWAFSGCQRVRASNLSWAKIPTVESRYNKIHLKAQPMMMLLE